MNTHSKKLLLIHENVEILDKVASALISVGFSVGLTSCTDTALQILKDHDFDVVAVSARLENGSRNKLFEELKRLYPRLPLVLLTDEGDDEEGRAQVTSEGFTYLISQRDTHQISVMSQAAMVWSAPGSG